MVEMLQLVAWALGVASGCLQLSCTCSPAWKVKSQAETVTTTSSQFEGLWMSCAANAVGSVQCSVFKTVLGLPAYLQACRALMIISVLFSLVSFCVSTLGFKCMNISRISEQMKDRMVLSGGTMFVLSGVLTLTAVSWYAARVIYDFHDPLYSGVRFEPGSGLYMGWVASCLAILAGAMICCSFRRSSSVHPAGTFSYHSTSRGQSIYKVSAASSGRSCRAYV